MIKFGPYSILLSIGTAHGIVLAVLLLRTPANKAANRLLALLITLVALRILPYIMGFAGFYDVWPWLSFFPYEYSLAIGAVIWLYMHVICTGSLPPRWKWHLAPGVLQGAYYASVFVQPLTFKDRWDTVAHVPVVMPLETVWSFIALTVYLALAWHAHGRYQRWLDTALSNREEFRLPWPRRFLLACSATVAVWGATSLFDAAVGGLTYFDRFPLYIWFSVLVYGLGLGGWRSATLTYPRPWTLAEPEVVATAVAPAISGDQSKHPAPPDAEAVGDADSAIRTERPLIDRQTDWRLLAQRFDEAVRHNGWWRDAELTAPRLARLLATNTTYLSRALNDGLGQNFNEYINRLRVEAVQAELKTANGDRDLLAVALDAGFNSKASFNRVFKRFTGVTPTAFRQSNPGETSQIP